MFKPFNVRVEKVLENNQKKIKVTKVTGGPTFEQMTKDYQHRIYSPAFLDDDQRVSALYTHLAQRGIGPGNIYTPLEWEFEAQKLDEINAGIEQYNKEESDPDVWAGEIYYTKKYESPRNAKTGINLTFLRLFHERLLAKQDAFAAQYNNLVYAVGSDKTELTPKQTQEFANFGAEHKYRWYSALGLIAKLMRYECAPRQNESWPEYTRRMLRAGLVNPTNYVDHAPTQYMQFMFSSLWSEDSLAACVGRIGYFLDNTHLDPYDLLSSYCEEIQQPTPNIFL